MLAGHVDIGNTANFYAHLDTTDLETALRALAEEPSYPAESFLPETRRFAGLMEAAGIEPASAALGSRDRRRPAGGMS
jgi:hypothetical protein